MPTIHAHKMIMLLGNPISHSLSPAMHNAHFKHLGLNMDYFAMECEKERLSSLLSTLRSPLFAGANVTKPFKTIIVPMLDEVVVKAKLIRAVNTIVSRNGKLIGYNTDGIGFVKDVFREMRPQKVLILGAGGAGSAVGLSLAMEKVEVDYYDVIEERAQSCAYSSASFAPSKAVNSIDTASYQVVINATGLGMHGDLESTPLLKKEMNQETFYIDLTYAPKKTRFLQEAESVGAHIKNGYGMVIEQGALAFECWTSKTADRDFIRAYMDENFF